MLEMAGNDPGTTVELFFNPLILNTSIVRQNIFYSTVFRVPPFLSANRKVMGSNPAGKLGFSSYYFPSDFP